MILATVQRSWPISTSALRSSGKIESSATSADEGTGGKCRESGSNGRVDDCIHPAEQRLPGLARCVEFRPQKVNKTYSYKYILQDLFLIVYIIYIYIFFYIYIYACRPLFSAFLQPVKVRGLKSQHHVIAHSDSSSKHFKCK